jgi:hypothetical protein
MSHHPKLCLEGAVAEQSSIPESSLSPRVEGSSARPVGVQQNHLSSHLPPTRNRWLVKQAGWEPSSIHAICQPPYLMWPPREPALLEIGCKPVSHTPLPQLSPEMISPTIPVGIQYLTGSQEVSISCCLLAPAMATVASARMRCHVRRHQCGLAATATWAASAIVCTQAPPMSSPLLPSLPLQFHPSHPP